MSIKKYSQSVALLLMCILPCHGQENSLREHVVFLADSIGNRYPGSDGDLAAQYYISRHFTGNGLECRSHVFEIVEYVWGTGALQLHKGEKVTDFRFGSDFTVSGSGAADTLLTGYVVVGNSLPDSLLSHLKDKTVIQLLQRNGNNVAKHPISIHDIKQAGARAQIHCMPPGTDVKTRKTKGNRRPQPHQIPILNIRHDHLVEFLPQGIIDSIADRVYIAPPSHRVSIAAQHHEQLLHTANIIGIKKGTCDKHIIIGAHYDTCAPDPKTGAPRIGANDNASGVAMLLELAERLHDISTQHNIIFVAFGGEEKGCLGSMAFVNEMPFKSADITEMINLDMVGKMTNGRLFFKQFHEPAIRPDDIRTSGITLTEGPDAGSDHADFVRAHISASYFHTGSDPTIHTPEDTSDKLNYMGMTQILNFLLNYIIAVDRS